MELATRYFNIPKINTNRFLKNDSLSGMKSFPTFWKSLNPRCNEKALPFTYIKTADSVHVLLTKIFFEQFTIQLSPTSFCFTFLETIPWLFLALKKSRFFLEGGGGDKYVSYNNMNSMDETNNFSAVLKTQWHSIISFLFLFLRKKCRVYISVCN